MSLESIGIDETLAVRRLKKRAVIREAAPGLFYFDEDVWEAVRSTRRRMALLLVGTVTLVLLLIAYGVVTLQ
jgi:predicted acetyltransferase